MCPEHTLGRKVATTTALCFNAPCESWLSCINNVPVSCPRHAVGFLLISKVCWVLLASIKWPNGELPALGWRLSHSLPTSKCLNPNFHISFSMTTSCLQYMLRSIGFVLLFSICLHALSTFSNPTCGSSLLLFQKKKAGKNNDCSVIVIPANPVMTYCSACPLLSVLINSCKTLEPSVLSCRLNPFIGFNQSFGKRKSLLTSLATTYKNTFSPAVKAVWHLFFEYFSSHDDQSGGKVAIGDGTVDWALACVAEKE